MPSASAFSRLLDDLKLGLSCVTQIWRYETRDWVTSVYAADIDQDGDIEVLAGARDGRAYALTRDGRKIWERVVGKKVWVSSIVGLAQASDQHLARVVAGTRDGKIFVLDKDGQELPLLLPGQDTALPMTDGWCDVHQAINQLQADPSAPLTVVFGSENRSAYGFDLASGQVRWRFSTNGQVRGIAVHDLNGDGRPEVLVGSEDYTLYILSSSGQEMARYEADQAIYTLFADDVDRDGEAEILVGTRTKRLHVLTPDLREKWSLSLGSRPLAITVADVNNDQRLEILVACDDKVLYILDDTGRLIWHQKFPARFSSLFAIDLDHDGHVEILAGADDKSIYGMRIQLSKNLDKKIRRDYAASGRPPVATLFDLTLEQRDLLLSMLGGGYEGLDKSLDLEMAAELLEEGDIARALPALLKLNQQKFIPIWERDPVGYRRALCLADFTGDTRPTIVAGSPEGGLFAFTAAGRLLWSKTFPGEQIVDVQPGYLSKGRNQDLVFVSSAGHVFFMNMDKKRETVLFAAPEPIFCFYVLAPTRTGPSEILCGTESGQVYLYTNDFTTPAQVLHLPTTVQRVYASDPYEGLYRTPEILVSTSSNQLFAYSRGGNHLWTYETHDRVQALCARDLDDNGRLEVLIGTEGCNIHVLDDHGNLRWRYALYHSVLALDVADLDGDGNLEILAGCADGILYAFTANGDLIWRYQVRDRIQSLRVADIDQDGNMEIMMVAESHLEVLRTVNQVVLSDLLTLCWSRLFGEVEPFEALLPLLKSDEPYLRAAALSKLAELDPLPPQTFDLLSEAARDTFVDVRKVLPEALMRAFPADPARARTLLYAVSQDGMRDVRIEIVEHLELLARVDWSSTLTYLRRAIQSSDRNTRRAAIRKISHLIADLVDVSEEMRATRAEALFQLLLAAAQDAESEWIRLEAGRVLADLANLYPEDTLVSLSTLLKNQLQYHVLRNMAYNLVSAEIQQACTGLLALTFDLTENKAPELLADATKALERVRGSVRLGSDLWLIFREIQDLFGYTSLEELATYSFRLRAEQFQAPDANAQAFLRIGERLSTITRPLKTYLSRNDPNDRLGALLDTMNALDVLRRLVDHEYGVSLLPDVPQPRLPEFVALKTLLAHWGEMLSIQRNDLRGHADLTGELQSRQVHFDDAVGIWLKVTNHGRGSANNVKVTLLSNEHCEFLRSSFETDAIFAHQEVVAEFLIKPSTSAPLALTFEILYDDSERDAKSFTLQEYLDFIEWQGEFVPTENPYTTGTPVQDSRMCYGREEDLAYLRDNLIRTTSQTVLVLYGQRRSGKTTLLYQLANTDILGEHIPVMIDLQRLSYNMDIGNFLFRVSYAISQALRKRALPISTPVRTDFVCQEDFEPDPMFSFDCFLDEVEILLCGRKLILLLDEFEVLETQVRKAKLKPEIFEYLRSLMQQRQYMHFLLSGTHHIEHLTRAYWSVFFNIALHHRLPGRITANGAEALITEPVARTLEYEETAVTKIHQLTADQPYLIHLLCRSLVDRCNQRRKNYATINDVNEVLREVIATGAVHFDWLWDQIDPARRLLLQVIAEGARDEGRQLSLDDISAVYRQYHYPYSHDEVVASLKTLWAEDVVETNTGEQLEDAFDKAHYYVSIGLLYQWLRHEKPLTLQQGQGTIAGTNGATPALVSEYASD